MLELLDKFLSKVKVQIIEELVEFCNRERATIILIPIEDPIAIITSINIEYKEIGDIEFEVKIVNKIINNISILNNIKIIFFRHQHSLIRLIINKIFIKILRYFYIQSRCFINY